MAGGDLKALRDRLRAATGASHDLNRDIWLALGATRHGKSWWRLPNDATAWADLPNITGSIDAALALCERKLPGALFTADGGPPWNVTIWCDEYTKVGDASHVTFPLAILIALLEAMIGKETGDA